MPALARANGLWGGPRPVELTDLTYAELRVVQLARLYVSVKRVFLEQASYAATPRSAAPMYHERNVVAYPRNPDTVVLAVGLMPDDLCKALTVQFVGNSSDALRYEPSLMVSVDRLRRAFSWLSTNCWPWMEATKFSGVLGSSNLGDRLETLLRAYSVSLGGDSEGIPREIFRSAVAIPDSAATVQHAGPSDAVAADGDDEDDAGVVAAPMPDECAAAIDGGVDDLGPLHLWDEIMRKYGVAQECAKALDRLDANEAPTERDRLERERLLAVEAAVDALARIKHRDVQAKLQAFHVAEAGRSPGVCLSHASEPLSNFDPHFWVSCFGVCSAAGTVRSGSRGHCGTGHISRRTAGQSLSSRGLITATGACASSSSRVSTTSSYGVVRCGPCSLASRTCL